VISTVKGRLVEKNQSSVVVEVGGLGYEVFVPGPLLARESRVGENLRLFTHLHVREDAIRLYGFAEREERELFVELLTVSRLGPSLALSILSSLTVDDFKRAVLQSNTSRLVEIKGIGQKTAERIILELKERLTPPKEEYRSPAASAENNTADALEALLSLGYDRSEADSLVDRALSDLKSERGNSAGEVPVQMLIKRALAVASE